MLEVLGTLAILLVFIAVAMLVVLLVLLTLLLIERVGGDSDGAQRRASAGPRHDR